MEQNRETLPVTVLMFLIVGKADGKTSDTWLMDRQINMNCSMYTLISFSKNMYNLNVCQRGSTVLAE